MKGREHKGGFCHRERRRGKRLGQRKKRKKRGGKESRSTGQEGAEKKGRNQHLGAGRGTGKRKRRESGVPFCFLERAGKRGTHSVLGKKKEHKSPQKAQEDLVSLKRTGWGDSSEGKTKDTKAIIGKKRKNV